MADEGDTFDLDAGKLVGAIDENEVGRLGLQLGECLLGEVVGVDASAGDLLLHERCMVNGRELVETELRNECTGLGAEVGALFD